MSTSPPVLLLGAGAAAYSEFPLARIAAAHPVVLVDTIAPDWARPYLAGHIAADPASDAVADAVTTYAKGRELGGVLSYMPAHLITAARIAHQLRLPAPPLDALAACEDRIAVRRLLTQCSVPLPRWAEARDAEAAAAHAEVIGYPVIVKPRPGSGTCSLQTRNRAGVPAVYDRVRRAVSHSRVSEGVLVEESLEGAQVCAETVVDGSDIRIVAITRTTTSPPPARQALRHCVYAHDKLLHDRFLRQVVTRAVHAMGLNLAVLHVTMTLTARGPRVTDVSAHLADDLIPLLVKRATGIDLPQVAADLATGHPPDLTPTRQRAAAVYFAYPAITGRIERLEVTTEATQLPLVDCFVLTRCPGQEVVAAPHGGVEDRLAHCVVLGADAAACHSTLDRMEQQLTVAISAPVATSGLLKGE